METRTANGEAVTTLLGRCLVTGAAGYLGSWLVRDLLSRGLSVRGFDIESPASVECGTGDGAFEARTGDVRRRADVEAAMEGIDTVFHAAAVLNFLTYPTRQERERSYAVNVDGTENVLRAAEAAGVSRLIYTSTNNVSFTGEVINGDETWPYAEGARDLYTTTKILGEKAALAANGRDGLSTCAIRPGGIFGPGEKHYLPRLVEQCARGRMIATLGGTKPLSENSFIDNLVSGHVEAARHLVPGSPVCGQAYFINDDHPVNYFEYFRPLIEGMGFRFPRFALPIPPLYGAFWIWERLHQLLHVPPPPLVCLEIAKVSTSHYNSVAKAKRDFGWEPRVSHEEASNQLLAYCKDLLRERAWERPTTPPA